MGKPQAPAAPDYAAAANAQGSANVNSAVASNYLNQVNQSGPQGSLNYSYDYANGYLDPQTGKMIPHTTATTTLSPEQQKLYDQNVGLSTSLNDLASKGLGYVGNTLNTPASPNGLPAGGTAPGTPNFTNSVDRTSASGGPIVGSVGTSPYTSSYDYSGASKAPTLDDYSAQRDQITNALMARAQPSLDRSRSMKENQLANQGINLGSEAYSAAQNDLGTTENDARTSALLAGSSEQQRLFNEAMASRQQGVSEAQSQGQIANEAAAGNFGQGLAAGTFANTAQAQGFDQSGANADRGFSQGMANAGLGNTNAGNTFNMGLARAQYLDQARQQALQEQDYFRNQPLNMLNALRTGNQATMPTFGNASGGAQIAAAPVYAATNDQYQAAQDQYKSQMAGYSALLGGLGSLGGAAITKFSDRKLKANVEKLWTMANGLGVYAYNYVGSKVRTFGYMADEVEKLYPNAVRYIGSYASVDYGMVR